jgi:hypothetical protein
VVLNNSVAYRQTESGPFADVFGCEKGIEHLADVFRRDPCAVVLEFNAQPGLFVGRGLVSIRSNRCSDFNSAAVR